MKMWMPGRFGLLDAPAAPRSTSCSRGARQRQHDRLASPPRRRARTASKSPSDDAAKPASMTSTPSRSSWRAITSFSSTFMVAPGDCSPSRSVVSKICTRSIVASPFLATAARSIASFAPGPRNTKATSGCVRPWPCVGGCSGAPSGPCTPARAAGGMVSRRPRASASTRRDALDHRSELYPPSSRLVKHDRSAARVSSAAGTGCEPAAGDAPAHQTATSRSPAPTSAYDVMPRKSISSGAPIVSMMSTISAEQDRERMALVQLDLLEGEVAELAHHQHRHRVDQQQHEDVLVRSPSPPR